VSRPELTRGIWWVRGQLLLIAAALATAAGVTAVAATARNRPPQELTQLKDGAGRDLTIGRCIVCHSLEYIPSNAPAMNRAGWQKTIQKMRERFGAPLTDGEAKEILDYLAANYSGKPQS
jgi:sulfite dehydrogenase (cytochrome) subunit B